MKLFTDFWDSISTVCQEMDQRKEDIQ